MTLKIKDVKPGDYLIPDGGFTCLKKGRPVMVRSTKTRFDPSTLFVPCSEGNHYLVGQIDGQGNLVGLRSTR